MNPVTKAAPTTHYHIPQQSKHRQILKNNNSRQINNVTFPVTFIQHQVNQKSKDNSYINNVNISPLRDRQNNTRKVNNQNQDEGNKFDIALKKNNKLKKQNQDQNTSNNLYTLRVVETNNLNSTAYIPSIQNKSNSRHYKNAQNDIRQYYSQGYEQADDRNSVNMGNNRKQSSRTKKVNKYCSTHRKKVAQYKYIEKDQNCDVMDDGLYYCDICAMKLISKGFHLQRVHKYSQNYIQSRIVNDDYSDQPFQYENRLDYQVNNHRKTTVSTHQKKNQQHMVFNIPQNSQNFYHVNSNNSGSLLNNHSNNLVVPSQGPNMKQSRLKCSKYTKNSYIQQAENLADNIIQLKGKYEKLMEQSENQQNQHIIADKKDDESERQIQLIEKYYQKLIQIITQYKIKHVNKIKNKIRDKNNLPHENDDDSFIYKDHQQQNIYSAYKQKIRHNLQELETMAEDLTFTDFDEVMEKLTQDDFNMCCDVYKNKVIMFVDDYQFIMNQIRKLKWQQNQLYKNLRKNTIKDIQKPKKESKVNVKQIQQTIDKIQKEIKLFYDPGLEKSNKRSSNSWHKFLTQFQKQSNARAFQKPKSYDGKKQAKQGKKGNFFKIFEDQNKENNEIISPQFKKI